MIPCIEIEETADSLMIRIDRATDMLLESMSIWDSERMRRRVNDAFYLLLEGTERAVTT